MASVEVTLLYADGRKAIVEPGLVISYEMSNGVRVRMLVTRVDPDEPRIMGTALGTTLTDGCRTNQVVGVEKKRG